MFGILKLVELSLLLNYYIWKMLTWWGRGRERGRIHVKQKNVTTAITPLLLYSHHHPGHTTGMPTSLSPLYCHKETLTDLSQSPMGDATLCQHNVRVCVLCHWSKIPIIFRQCFCLAIYLSDLPQIDRNIYIYMYQ